MILTEITLASYLETRKLQILRDLLLVQQLVSLLPYFAYPWTLYVVKAEASLALTSELFFRFLFLT